MIFHRLMGKEIQQKSHYAKNPMHANVNGNCQEEVIIFETKTNKFFFALISYGSCFCSTSAVSPTKTNSVDHLQKEMTHLNNPNQQTSQVAQVRKSPKKRPLKRYTIVSSSSSTESLTSDTKGNEIEGMRLKNKSHILILTKRKFSTNIPN